jgi:hypothetical protein
LAHANRRYARAILLVDDPQIGLYVAGCGRSVINENDATMPICASSGRLRRRSVVRLAVMTHPDVEGTRTYRLPVSGDVILNRPGESGGSFF